MPSLDEGHHQTRKSLKECTKAGNDWETSQDSVSAERSLFNTRSSGNVFHAVERLTQDSKLTEEDGKQTILQFTLSCS